MSQSSVMEQLIGTYSTEVYLPVSILSKSLKRLIRKAKGQEELLYDAGELPKVKWNDYVTKQKIALVDTEKRDRNSRLSELGILSHAAAGAEPGSLIFEIGTFDGRTTLHLALNAPDSCEVATIDLPPAEGVTTLPDDSVIGSRYRAFAGNNPGRLATIRQNLGDSTKFDFSPFYGKCGLVFVDGSHSYADALSDSEQAFQLVRPGGVVIWHDYGIWDGVNQALDELNTERNLNLVHFKGTTLVYWRK